MSREHFVSPFGEYTEAASTGGPGRWIYVSGQVGYSPEGKLLEDPSAHAGAALDRLEDVLASAGARLSDVVKLTVFYTDPERNAEFKAARAARFEKPFPAVTAVRVVSVGAGSGLEIEAVAFVAETPA